MLKRTHKRMVLNGTEYSRQMNPERRMRSGKKILMRLKAILNIQKYCLFERRSKLFPVGQPVSRLVNKFHKLRSSGRAEVSPLIYNAVIMKS
jgi:hypothetical protein